jgi:phytoene dehydrogenase-like protein
MLHFHQNNLTPALDTRYPLSGNQQFDLIVAGAGTAGLAAAITAARSGHRTLLIARRSVLGGNSGDLLVHSMSGFFRTSPDVIPLPANRGFAMEFARRLRNGPFRTTRPSCAVGRIPLPWAYMLRY